VPALFECSQESVFQFGGDVAVGFDDAVVEAVAESAALGDFGDVVGDEPGFVAVSESVEGQAAPDRGGVRGPAALDGGPEDSADEGRAPLPGAGGCGEDELEWMGFQVLAQYVDEERR
jgi:hypothetical protein